MDDTTIVGTILAALEIAPAEPSDVTDILRNPVQRRALLTQQATEHASPLTRYLCERLEIGRIDHWYKYIERTELHRPGRTLVFGDRGYPARLADCYDAPPVLFARGEAPAGPAIAIVGSREATADTLARTRSLAAKIARVGVTVVSGLAAGVDTAAHLGALDADGYTIAVMGTGIEHTFPLANSDLAEKITGRGALLSQFPPDAPRTSTTFLRRNCVIAGLSQVSLVMAGRERSGSRHEIEQAINYGRTALMWAPSLEPFKWAQDLHLRGLASFVSSEDEVLSALAVGS